MQLFTKYIFAIIFIIGSSACQTKPVDYSIAPTEELERLYKRGDLKAGYTLGFRHFFNDDNSLKDNVSDVELGLAYLQEAHDNGHMDAHSNLSAIYRLGLFGVPENFDKANIYNLEGAERGSNVGKLNYGLHNLSNTDKKIADRAHAYLVEVASDDLIGGVANEHLARLYYFGNDDFEVNYENARLFAENCVLFGDSRGWCEFILARDMSKGWGGPIDEQRSAELFLQSANIGEPRAFWYASMNALNGNYVEKNETEAFRLVKLGADANDKKAIISLAVKYALGEGTEVNFDKSYATYERAAKLNSPHAIRSMAGMHCDGQGQEVNHQICGAGLLLATEHGDGEAPRIMKIRFDITEDDIAQMRENRPSEEAFWTDQYPWLLDVQQK